MVRLVIGVVLLGSLAGGGVLIWREPALKNMVTRKAVALMDQALGIVHSDRSSSEHSPPPKPAVTREIPRKVEPPKTAPVYVDRSPAPTAVERVRPEDKQLLTDILDRKLPAKPVAKGHTAPPAKAAVAKGNGRTPS